MRDMEGTRKRAIIWIVGCALYSAAALIMSIAWGWSWAAAFIPLVCMICAAACFELGGEYQFEAERNFDELKMKPENEKFEWQNVEENTYAKVLCCKRCHGSEFRKVADRLVCNICGEVMGVDHGEKET